MTSATHPLFGRLLGAHHFRRVDGVVFLVVVLPDGSPGTIRADATDVLGGAAADQAVMVLDGEGLRALRAMVIGLQTRRCVPAVAADDK